MKPIEQIYDCDLTVRTANTLLLVGIFTIDELMSADIFELAYNIYRTMSYPRKVLMELAWYRSYVEDLRQ
jgi:hypothetical protein